MRLKFYSHGKLHSLNFKTQNIEEESTASLTKGPLTVSPFKMMRAQATRMDDLFRESKILPENLLIASNSKNNIRIIPTETLFLSEATKSVLKELKSKWGMTVVREGTFGKVLLKSPESGIEGIQQVFEASRDCIESGRVGVAHPNFLRMYQRVAPSAPGGAPLWNHRNDGNPGLAGADVAAEAAWTITRGIADVRIAVLDEGVDTRHTALKAAVIEENDFVDSNKHARPDGNDAHGTACAGIIVSRDRNVPGLASECSLVAVRIAKGDGNDGWIFDDFATADAIDWTWNEAKADVLSNSWGGGPPVDGITRAFERARTHGRGGLGSVIVAASGNSNSSVDYPASLSGIIAVGASNAWDERKSPTSQDGETLWGSCYGRELGLLAPGVQIATTDISGAAGYSTGNFVYDFNGTSSACPHVAAAAGLVLSVSPHLNEDQVRRIILQSTDKLTANGRRTNEFGEGRLNLFQAIRLARRA